ncbi:TetR/AcrR family transcriptional regulator [Gordonia lacunae]|uniref:HTH tetR-type domain-containing protein n=1 Tax=Gordonia lacunae TaxID=417102 RepID=A0A243Q3B5_9ACTN|nr:helix-turn-helix domain-containing protein [Gordonia lacunae]OUC75744.1 hypothetical protein CA982_25090 [Gordonia lacunae]
MPKADPVSRRERPAKPALSRSAIVDAAVALLEREGVDKVTMRRVAAELDTGPASLYVYVRNTASLHALILDRLLGGLDLEWDGSEPWRARLTRVMTDYTDLLAQRAALARAALFVWPDGPNYLDLLELLLRLLDAAGADARTSAWAVDLLLQQAGASAAESATRALGTGQDLDDLTITLQSADPTRHATLCRIGTDLLLAGNSRERTQWAFDALIAGILSLPPAPAKLT